VVATVTRGRVENLVFRAEPGLIERTLVGIVLFINLFGTPADWFSQNSGSASGPESNPLLVFGTFLIVAVLCLGLVGNSSAFVAAVAAEPYLAIFVLFTVASIFWSVDFAASINAIINFLLLTILGYLLVVRFRFIEIVQIVTVMMAIGCVMNLAWVLALGSLGQTAGGWDGLGSQKNALGTTVVLALPFFALYLRARPRGRFVLYLMIILAVVLVVGSQSKTSLASGLLTLVAAVVYVGFRAKKTLYGAVVITLIATSIVAALFATANLAFFADALDKDVTLTGRTQVWSLLVDAIEERPLFGYGLGGFWNGYLSPAHEIWVAQSWEPTHAHNAALQVAVQLGLIGLGLFLIINVRAIIRSTSRIRYVDGPLGLLPLVYLTLVLMSSITESGVIEQRFGWVMFIVMVVSAKMTVAERTQQDLRDHKMVEDDASDSPEKLSLPIA
jgi:exopolysaccharide production protein ExoQ